MLQPSGLQRQHASFKRHLLGGKRLGSGDSMGYSCEKAILRDASIHFSWDEGKPMGAMLR